MVGTKGVDVFLGLQRLYSLNTYHTNPQERFLSFGRDGQNFATKALTEREIKEVIS